MVTQLIPAISVEFLVRVRSLGTLRLDVEGVEHRTTSGSPTLALAVRNTGVWKTDLTGDVLLYPESGGFPERAQIPVRSNGRPMSLYPGMLIRLNCRLPRRLPVGEYTVVARLDLGENRESRARLVRVRNVGEVAIALKATIEDARLESDGSWTFGRSDESVPGLAIEVAPDSLVVEPNRTGQFRTSVRLDKGATIESAIIKGVRLTGSAVDGSSDEGWETIYDTGALLVITPAARGDAQVDILRLTLVRTSPDRNPGSAILSIANSGGATGRVKGSMILRRMSGQVIATMAIGENRWEPVMPGGRREFRMPLPLVDEGVFVVEAEIVQEDPSVGPRRTEVDFTSTEVIPEGLR
jgi:hypothetical protein